MVVHSPMFDFIQTLILKVTDLCFPPSEESGIVRDLSPQSVKLFLRPRPVGEVIALSQFNSLEVRALIHEAKFRSNTRAHELLALLLCEYIQQHDTLLSALWVPIPLSPARMRIRGYNQVREVLRQVAPRLPLHVNHTLLVRQRDTQPQTELSREKRLSNMTGAFSIREPHLIHNEDIIVLDDVLTTGATLRAAKAAFLPHSPRSITLIALAH